MTRSALRSTDCAKLIPISTTDWWHGASGTPNPELPPTDSPLDNLYLISKAKQIRKNFDDLPAERKAEVWAKMHETRNKAIRRDQLRLRWGLEPRGGLVKRLPK